MPETTTDTASAIAQLPSVQEHIRASLLWFHSQVETADQISYTLSAGPPYIQSPIEAIFAVWWDAFSAANPYLKQGIEIVQQSEVGIGKRRYFADFEVVLSDTDVYFAADSMFGMKWQRIFIELDGHDYHERTKTQVVQRNTRDRDFIKSDFKIFHFSGSEIHSNPTKVLSEVTGFAWSAWCRYRSEFFSRLHPFYTR